MGKKIENIVIICLLVSIYFFVISCDFDTGDEDNDFESGILGNHLNLNGQVYERMPGGGFEKWNSSDDLEIRTLLGGSGVLKKNGQFSFNVGTPNQYDPHFVWGRIYFKMEELNNFKISPVSVQMALFSSLTVDFNSDYSVGLLECIPQTSKNDMEDVLEYVYFVYVDKDVTISADKTNYIETIYGGQIFPEDTFGEININYTIDAFNHSLKAGWNAVFVRTIFEDDNTILTFLHANPRHLKWTLGIIHIPPFQD
jgi:hypothetical protein